MLLIFNDIGYFCFGASLFGQVNESIVDIFEIFFGAFLERFQLFEVEHEVIDMQFVFLRGTIYFCLLEEEVFDNIVARRHFNINLYISTHRSNILLDSSIA
jgi:hypothetical protein